jgi:hypothetical protein
MTRANKVEGLVENFLRGGSSPLGRIGKALGIFEPTIRGSGLHGAGVKDPPAPRGCAVPTRYPAELSSGSGSRDAATGLEKRYLIELAQLAVKEVWA